MLDLRLIREKPDFVKQRLATRGAGDETKIAKLIEIDVLRRKWQTELQQLQAERNRLSKQIGTKKQRGDPTDQLEELVSRANQGASSLNAQITFAEGQQDESLLDIPNLPDESVPVGKDAGDNKLIRSWGEKPELKDALDHVALGERLKLFDLERAAKLSGSGFICFTGAGARLERALIQFMLDLHTREHGYEEMSPPFLVRRECMIGTSQLPKFEADMYGLQNNQLFLAPTAEVQ